MKTRSLLFGHVRIYNKPTRPLGVILYQGPSQLDGKPIVVIATFESRNEKTGNMVQTWILQQTIDPVNSVKNGLDGTVCGDCRFSSGRGCYVNVGQAPLAVWSGYHRGIYPVYNPLIHSVLFNGRRIRIGSYGDPAVVPVEYFHRILARSAGHTGYTHQWRTHPEYKGMLQASCDNAEDYDEATRSGWKCFTVIPSYDRYTKDLTPGETVMTDLGIVCLSESHGKTCAECKLCTGNRVNIVIAAHGTVAKIGKARISLATA